MITFPPPLTFSRHGKEQTGRGAKGHKKGNKQVSTFLRWSTSSVFFVVVVDCKRTHQAWKPGSFRSFSQHLISSAYSLAVFWGLTCPGCSHRAAECYPFPWVRPQNRNLVLCPKDLHLAKHYYMNHKEAKVKLTVGFQQHTSVSVVLPEMLRKLDFCLCWWWERRRHCHSAYSWWFRMVWDSLVFKFTGPPSPCRDPKSCTGFRPLGSS